jgi:hypothetical protein
MTRLITLLLLLIGILASGVAATRALGSSTVEEQRFAHLLSQDSALLDGQWRWREVFPGRDTMEYARLLLHASTPGFFTAITGSPETRIDWFSGTGWNGQLFRDNDVPPPHVYSIVLRAPPSLPSPLTLGEAILIYGMPAWSYTINDSRYICFAYGVCAMMALRHERLSPRMAVISLSYLPTAVVERQQRLTKTATIWRGFTVYGR